MKKVFKIADIRNLERQVANGEITYSRMVEILNEKAYYEYIVNRTDDKNKCTWKAWNEKPIEEKVVEIYDELNKRLRNLERVNDLPPTKRCG